MRRVAIMQPTYLPWSGYFGLMQSVDLFIFLDTVQFAHRSWQQRNQIKTANGPMWLTVPVRTKGRREQRIADVEIEESGNFGARHHKSIEFNYEKAPFFESVATEFLPLLKVPRQKLCELNIEAILSMKEMLDISTPVLCSSELDGNGAKADLLASLCREVDATEYISPPGSRDYLEASDAFEKLDIPVRYFDFDHPVYPQLFGEFLPFMSCLDMLFNCGGESRHLVRKASGVSR